MIKKVNEISFVDEKVIFVSVNPVYVSSSDIEMGRSDIPSHSACETNM